MEGLDKPCVTQGTAASKSIISLFVNGDLAPRLLASHILACTSLSSSSRLKLSQGLDGLEFGGLSFESFMYHPWLYIPQTQARHQKALHPRTCRTPNSNQQAVDPQRPITCNKTHLDSRPRSQTSSLDIQQTRLETISTCVA